MTNEQMAKQIADKMFEKFAGGKEKVLIDCKSMRNIIEALLDVFMGAQIQLSPVQTVAPELLEALEQAVTFDGGKEYNGEDDEIGRRACCRVVSYKEHKNDCWVSKAKSAISKAKGEV